MVKENTMTTKNETVTSDNGSEHLNWDELKLIAPDLFAQFVEAARKREQENLLRGTYVEAVSAAIHNAAAALATYRDAYSELQTEIALLKEKGGSIADVPEYRQYRTDNGQSVTAKGKPTNMEMVVQHFMHAPTD
jgi:hypothetical protein